MFASDRKIVPPLALLAAFWLAGASPAPARGLELALIDRGDLGLPPAPQAGKRLESFAPVPLPAAPRDAAPETPRSAPAPDRRNVQAIPEIHRDFDALPAPVRRMREQLLEAAQSGDIEKLRPLLDVRDHATQLPQERQDGDAIAFLKSLAGDSEGREILAIIVDLLDTGYVRLHPGTEDEVYVWPYFYAMPLDRLTPPQTVELFRIVTAGDFEDMKKAGGYIFYSIGIGPDGSWRFFSAGEEQ